MFSDLGQNNTLRLLCCFELGPIKRSGLRILMSGSYSPDLKNHQEPAECSVGELPFGSFSGLWYLNLRIVQKKCHPFRTSSSSGSGMYGGKFYQDLLTIFSNQIKNTLDPLFRTVSVSESLASLCAFHLHELSLAIARVTCLHVITVAQGWSLHSSSGVAKRWPCDSQHCGYCFPHCHIGTGVSSLSLSVVKGASGCERLSSALSLHK